MFSKDSLSTRVSLSLVLAVILAGTSHAQVQQPQTRPLQSGQRQPTQKQVYGPRQANPQTQRPNPNQQPRQAAPQQRVPLRQAQAQAQKKEWPPKEFKLTQAQNDRLDKMLAFWEEKTSDIKTLECTFGRWVYDPQFGPKDNAKTFATGQIRYAAVDRGMIREEAVYDFDAAKKKRQDQLKAALAQATTDGERKKLEAQIQQSWPFTARANAIGEHWVCDGKSVFEFSHKTKELVEVKLPAEMQGKAIADGPLPFMFGAEAAKIKKRYWIREEPRKAENQPFQLELLPKRMGEDYSKIVIQLDPEKFLPVSMTLHELNMIGLSKYSFRGIKADGAMNNLQNFLGGFVRPKTPRGWKKIVRDVGAPQPGPGPQQQAPRQAQGPTRPLK